MRPYLPKPTAKVSRVTDAARFDAEKLLSCSAPITWGALLGTLPSHMVSDLVNQARKINEQQPTCSLAEAGELAAVCSALSNLDQVPQNMFAPFSTGDNAGFLTTHWGNVDTGAMVNVVYLGVTRVFKELQQYWVDFNHALTGVGGKLTRIVGKLQDVPLCLGGPYKLEEVVPTTFYVVDNDSYHWILGLPLLATICGKVLCQERQLEYTPPLQGSRQLPLITRTEALASPTRLRFDRRSPHLSCEDVDFSSWPPANWHEEPLEYTGEDLMTTLRR